MPTMIYRGVMHPGNAEPVRKRPMDLIYRGFTHAGVSRPRPDLPTTVSMRYRGVAHGRTIAASRDRKALDDRTAITSSIASANLG